MPWHRRTLRGFGFGIRQHRWSITPLHRLDLYPSLWPKGKGKPDCGHASLTGRAGMTRAPASAVRRGRSGFGGGMHIYYASIHLNVFVYSKRPA